VEAALAEPKCFPLKKKYRTASPHPKTALPGLGMLRNLYRLLAPPSAHTIYYHRTRARVINYWHQGCQRATSVPPDHLQRNNEENRPRTARGCHVVPVGTAVDIVAKANWPFEKPDSW
jgi:hypothetical protein